MCCDVHRGHAACACTSAPSNPPPKHHNATAAAAKRVVKQGSKGPLVKEAQTLLVKHGVNCKIDGDFGPKTAQTVRDFQTKKGIPATGEVDQATWSILLA
jgi:peptidoglycan hydrolase-like protein with peptidoglycan-binding domain